MEKRIVKTPDEQEIEYTWGVAPGYIK